MPSPRDCIYPFKLYSVFMPFLDCMLCPTAIADNFRDPLHYRDGNKMPGMLYRSGTHPIFYGNHYVNIISYALLSISLINYLHSLLAYNTHCLDYTSLYNLSLAKN